jgi:hypothetical protein
MRMVFSPPNLVGMAPGGASTKNSWLIGVLSCKVSHQNGSGRNQMRLMT